MRRILVLEFSNSHVHRGVDHAQVLTVGTIDRECLQDATNISLATMLRIKRADMLVELKLSVNACRLRNSPSTDFSRLQSPYLCSRYQWGTKLDRKASHTSRLGKAKR